MNLLDQTTISSISTTSDIADWITGTLAPSYFTSQTTITQPIFPIFLFKSELNSACFSLSASDVDKDCSIITANLAEPTFDNANSFQRSSFFGKYPLSSYQEILRSVSTSELTTLNTNLKSSWLSSATVFLSVQSVAYNDWNKAYLQFVVDFELSYTGEVLSTRIGYNVTYLESVKKPLFMILYVVFLIQLMIFTIKIMFEFHLVHNMYTFFGHTLHFVAQYAFIFICAIEFQVAQSNVSYSTNLKEYSEMSSAISNLKNTEMVLAFILIFYPFRLFTLLAWDKYLSVPIKMIVVLYRTMPGITLIVFTFAILWCCYGLTAFIGLRDILYQAGSYNNSFFNFFSFEFGKSSTNTLVLNGSKRALFNIVWAFQALIIGIILIFTLVVLIDLVKRSFAHELPASLPHQQEFQDSQAELYTKFDKFLKELSNIFGLKNKDIRDANSFKNEDKMVIWLEHEMGDDSEVDDIIDQLDGEPIKIMVFYRPEEVEEFLKYLFRLKPNLLTSAAGSKFRIAYETKFEKVSAEKANIETLLDWLKDVGCRVPFLLYTKAQLERDTYMPMKRKYPGLFACDERSGALGFCRMESKLENMNFKLENPENKYIVLENSTSDISMGFISRTSVD